MKKYSYLIILMYLFTFSLYSDGLVFPAATKENREAYKSEMLKTIKTEMQAFTMNKKETLVKKSFDYMQILNYYEDDGYDFLRLTLKEYPVYSEGFYSSALETIYSIYQTGFEDEIKVILDNTKNPKHFIIAVYFLLRINPEARLDYLQILKTRFKNYEKVHGLKVLGKYLEVTPTQFLSMRPSLTDLFSNNYGEKNYILFSLQRENRDYPGICLIKKPDGKFLRREDGSIFTISQLARSVSNLPSYVVNGNSPQGVFSIQNIQVAKSDIIGPTPAIITTLPFESSVKDFFHLSKRNEKWKLDSYLKFLPSSWKDYYPMQEAYFAGEMGRNVIYAHGTTVDTEFYRDYSYYPNTPTKGCLSSKEIWSRKSGKNLYSDQLILVNAIKKLEPNNGYMIVVNIDKMEIPVSLDDVIMNILEAEESLD